MDIYIVIAFTIYLIILYTIGMYHYKRKQNATDFMVGNRSINYWVTAIGAQSSDMSSWLMLGFPASVYATGFFELWTAVGLVGGMFLNWHYVAPRLRRITGSLNELTLSSFFAHQFNDRSHYLQFISALTCLLFFTFYIASGLVGMGRIFEALFEVNYHTGIFIGLLTAGLYTLLGGFTAVAWSNMFQGLFLLATLIIVPVAAFWSLPGGLSSLLLKLHEFGHGYALHFDHYTILQGIILAISWGLGYFGQPHILVYFMGIDDPNKIRYAKYIGLAWQISALIAAVAIGVIALPFFVYAPTPIDLLFVYMAKKLLPSFVMGFVLCGILAAVLTTMNGHILIVGSVCANDIYKILKKHTTSWELITVSRIASVIICALAVFIAWDNNNSIYNLVNYAWSGLGSSFGPLVLAGLYGKNISSRSALAGLLTGTLTAALWPLTGYALFPLIPGFIANCTLLCITHALFDK